MPAPLIRPLTPADYAAALQLLRELRPQLEATTFTQCLTRQTAAGYRLIGAFAPELAGVLGLRPVETLARGRVLHVDDVVVTGRRRGGGIGRALMGFAEQEALRQGCQAMFVDSYADALPFYAELGYAPHGSVLVKKELMSGVG